MARWDDYGPDPDEPPRGRVTVKYGNAEAPPVTQDASLEERLAALERRVAALEAIR